MRTFWLYLLTFSTASVLAQKPSPVKPTDKASYYHDDFQGRNTSSGEVFDQADFTAAHRTLPFNEIVLVTNTINRKTAIVRINDRGPFRKSRAIDVSRAAAQRLGMIPFGVVPVRITPLHILDQYPISDTSFQENVWWNTKAQKTDKPTDRIDLWSTPDWKHAFYVASDLELQELDSEFFVHVWLDGNKTMFTVSVALKEKDNAERRLKHYRSGGFMRARIIAPTR